MSGTPKTGSGSGDGGGFCTACVFLYTVGQGWSIIQDICSDCNGYRCADLPTDEGEPDEVRVINCVVE